MDSDDKLNAFIKYLKYERQYSSKTITAYKTDLEKAKTYLQKHNGFLGWDKVTTNEIVLYLQSLNIKNARTTQARKLSSLRSFYKFLVRRHLATNNPAVDIEFAVGKRKQPDFFYEDEINGLLDSLTATDPLTMRNRALFELFYATGMRLSEVSHLLIDQIDFDLKMILVHGKGKKDRYVDFGNPAKTALLAYLSKSRPILLKNKSSAYVFLDRIGDRLTSEGISYVMKKVFKENGIDQNVHPHELRHTFAIQMLNHGADLQTIQELLGHVNLSSTQVYTHVTMKHLKDNYDKYFPK